VAIARALAVEPKVVLLDEPTTALDATSRTEVRAVLREQLAAFPGVTVLVTHTASEVLTLASRVLVMNDGLVVQDASPDELVLRPGSPWLAEMLSMNAWQGTVTEPSVIALDSGGQLQGVGLPSPGSPVLVTTSPTAVGLFSASPTGSVRNVWEARVEDVVVLGDRVRVTLIAQHSGPRRTVAEITRAAAAELGVRAGSHHFLALKATELTVSPL
jgi:molybdopterin-binding protein